MVFVRQIIITLIMSFGTVASAVHTRTCRSTFDDGAMDLVRESFQREFVAGYNCNYCRLNITNFLVELVKTHPVINPAEFQLVFIMTSSMAKDTSDGLIEQLMSFLRSEKRHYRISLTDRRLPPARAIIPDGVDPLPPWSFHVVLKFRGMVFDFDYTNSPTPITIDDYIRNLKILDIKSGDYISVDIASANSLLAITVPGDQVVGSLGELKPLHTIDELMQRNSLKMISDLE